MISENVKQTKKIAQDLASRYLKMKQKKDGAVVIGLSGDLGSGKTTFCQEFARALGIKEKVHSPTFVIMKKYSVVSNQYSAWFHFDAYRIKNQKEILALGWRKIISDPKNIVLIEWPEKIKKIFPKKHFWIKFSHLNSPDAKKGRTKRGIDIYFAK